MINLKEFLSNTLLEIDNMSIDKFEEICIEHGYYPEKRPSFSHKTELNEYRLNVNKKHKLVPSYRNSTSKFNLNDQDFSAAA